MPNSSPFKTSAGAAKYLAAYDAALSLWPVPHEALDVDTSFGSTHINVAGSVDLPPLILIHGISLSSTQWYPNITPLSRYCRVYALDVINQMGRSLATRPLRTRQDYAAWLLEVLDALHIERVSMVGHSYGGWLTLNLGLAAPQRVERMALLSPAASFAPIEWQFWVRSMMTALLPVRPLIYNFMQWTTTMPSVKGQAVIEQLVLGMKSFKLLELGVPFFCVYSDEELCNVSIPTLLLVGEREILYRPDRVLERARRLVPRIEAELIASGGHLFPVDQADATNTRILQFLNPR